MLSDERIRFIVTQGVDQAGRAHQIGEEERDRSALYDVGRSALVPSLHRSPCLGIGLPSSTGSIARGPSLVWNCMKRMLGVGVALALVVPAAPAAAVAKT